MNVQRHLVPKSHRNDSRLGWHRVSSDSTHRVMCCYRRATYWEPFVSSRYVWTYIYGLLYSAHRILWMHITRPLAYLFTAYSPNETWSELFNARRSECCDQSETYTSHKITNCNLASIERLYNIHIYDGTITTLYYGMLLEGSSTRIAHLTIY